MINIIALLVFFILLLAIAEVQINEFGGPGGLLVLVAWTLFSGMFVLSVYAILYKG